jgi:hypothetical protein
MCNAWNHPPGCTCGFGGEGHLGGGGDVHSAAWFAMRGYTLPSSAPRDSTWRYLDDYCRPTKCPRCDAEVFFIRHNGGSVWVDELGWPWPKHSCFDEVKDNFPSWIKFFWTETTRLDDPSLLIGIVAHARWIAEGETGPRRVVLAVDCGDRGRICLATAPTNTADYFLGQIMVVDLKNRRLLTSTHDRRPILDVPVHPSELNLGAGWQPSPPPGDARNA